MTAEEIDYGNDFETCKCSLPLLNDDPLMDDICGRCSGVIFLPVDEEDTHG